MALSHMAYFDGTERCSLIIKEKQESIICIYLLPSMYFFNPAQHKIVSVLSLGNPNILYKLCFCPSVCPLSLTLVFPLVSVFPWCRLSNDDNNYT